MTDRSTLTEQEIQAAYLAYYDLGPGYPQLPAPEYITSLYIDDTIEAVSLKFPPEWSPSRQLAVDRELEEALQQFLPLSPGSFDSIQVTFSGSIALDRALAAASVIVSPDRKDHVSVITTSPCIDIMKLFLEERRYIDQEFVESRASDPWGLSPDAVTDRIRKLGKDSGHGVIVLLSSPENPTGQHWRPAELQSIAAECAAAGAVLIVDHSFLTAGVHPPGMVIPVWEALDVGSNWIATWDTGKTFGLNEDKLGFLISGSQEASIAVKKALGIVQFGVARRQKMFFAEVFRRANNYDHTGNLRDICRSNMLTMKEYVSRSAMEAVLPEAGSLALLRLPAANSDERVRRYLLERGVGVVAGNVFFHTDWSRNDLLRVALARDPVHFAKGIDRLISELKLLYAS